MNKKETIICDKCGNIIPEDNKYYKVVIESAINSQCIGEIEEELKGDICRRCMKNFAIDEFTLRDEWGL